ncbi:hypothetical protein TRV_05711 [Trichophyton verrucosum HKI 0517]|uniref:Uncharacterized protein n=1 Tax=Trichophyton verrucosum (strain HKI 0517) TaxID=663202 RepID=D4DEX0_TRIVH|nr:uncharacterized protein TRV_05711 [Trichophyton verrucosum HKI 0517]EFE39609.1 hypothetical protein TRV_05711 [Trichophyton verrucosum HKI 0517]
MIQFVEKYSILTQETKVKRPEEKDEEKVHEDMKQKFASNCFPFS